MTRNILLALFSLTLSCVHATESQLTTTYQPLNGLGSGGIFVAPVTCHQWYSSSVAGPISFISAKNVPPTDNPKEANYDLNVASITGLKFSTSDLGDPQVPLTMTLDASKFNLRKSGLNRKEVLRASLECLRRCTTSERFAKINLTVKPPEKDAQWLLKIVDEFNKHDRMKVFFKPTP